MIIHNLIPPYSHTLSPTRHPAHFLILSETVSPLAKLALANELLLLSTLPTAVSSLILDRGRVVLVASWIRSRRTPTVMLSPIALSVSLHKRGMRGAGSESRTKWEREKNARWERGKGLGGGDVHRSVQLRLSSNGRQLHTERDRVWVPRHPLLLAKHLPVDLGPLGVRRSNLVGRVLLSWTSCARPRRRRRKGRDGPCCLTGGVGREGRGVRRSSHVRRCQIGLILQGCHPTRVHTGGKRSRRCGRRHGRGGVARLGDRGERRRRLGQGRDGGRARRGWCLGECGRSRADRSSTLGQAGRHEGRDVDQVSHRGKRQN